MWGSQSGLVASPSFKRDPSFVTILNLRHCSANNTWTSSYRTPQAITTISETRRTSPTAGSQPHLHRSQAACFARVWRMNYRIRVGVGACFITSFLDELQRRSLGIAIRAGGGDVYLHSAEFKGGMAGWVV